MHYIVLYPQNGDRIVTIDSVTSLYPMYTCVAFSAVGWSHRVSLREGDFQTVCHRLQPMLRSSFVFAVRLAFNQIQRRRTHAIFPLRFTCLKLIHTGTPDPTKLSCLCRVQRLDSHRQLKTVADRKFEVSTCSEQSSNSHQTRHRHHRLVASGVAVWTDSCVSEAKVVQCW